MTINFGPTFECKSDCHCYQWCPRVLRLWLCCCCKVDAEEVKKVDEEAQKHLHHSHSSHRSHQTERNLKINDIGDFLGR